VDLNPGGFAAGEPGCWAKSGGSCFLGTRCWSYCQARAERCPHGREKRAEQHLMTLRMRHPAVNTRQGPRCPAERYKLSPSLHKEQQRTLPCIALHQSPTRPVAPATDRSTAPLLLGTSLMWPSTFHPKMSTASGRPSPTPQMQMAHEGNPWTEAGETLPGRELAEAGGLWSCTPAFASLRGKPRPGQSSEGLERGAGSGPAMKSHQRAVPGIDKMQNQAGESVPRTRGSPIVGGGRGGS